MIATGRIETFKEVFDWIVYDSDFDHNLEKDIHNIGFYVNKLYIDPLYLTYKTECFELAPGLFEKVDALYELIKVEED